MTPNTLQHITKEFFKEEKGDLANDVPDLNPNEDLWSISEAK